MPYRRTIRRREKPESYWVNYNVGLTNTITPFCHWYPITSRNPGGLETRVLSPVQNNTSATGDPTVGYSPSEGEWIILASHMHVSFVDQSGIDSTKVPGELGLAVARPPGLTPIKTDSGTVVPKELASATTVLPSWGQRTFRPFSVAQSFLTSFNTCNWHGESRVKRMFSRQDVLYVCHDKPHGTALDSSWSMNVRIFLQRVR